MRAVFLPFLVLVVYHVHTSIASMIWNGLFVYAYYYHELAQIVMFPCKHANSILICIDYAIFVV